MRTAGGGMAFFADGVSDPTFVLPQDLNPHMAPQKLAPALRGYVLSKIADVVTERSLAHRGLVNWICSGGAWAWRPGGLDGDGSWRPLPAAAAAAVDQAYCSTALTAEVGHPEGGHGVHVLGMTW